ncbi:LacI family DNA-binding transcriptional regulator [Candidatus Sumerlaeota bacterium]|nr:LacI family DNA-binding transcriptional regulator [Candidatus Sumerlaeota bacterium]
MAHVKKRNVGIKDLSEKCSLSMMTVSRALRGAYGVNPKTRERVLRTAKEMGYIPNQVASNLAQNKTNTIGVIVPDIGLSFFPNVFHQLESEFSAQGYNLFICCSYDQPEKERKEVMALISRRVDGIVLAPASWKESYGAARLILDQDCPLVLIDRRIKGLDVDTVIVDDYGGAVSAVNHLIEQGFRRIVHLSGGQNIWTSRERLRGYRAALRDAKINIKEAWIILAGLTVESGEEAMTRLLEQNANFDAIFCVNDPVALGAYRALQRHGGKAPKPIALIGFAGIQETEMLETPLSTVQQDDARIGREAAQLLLNRIGPNANESKPVCLKIPTQLIIRASTTALIKS